MKIIRVSKFFYSQKFLGKLNRLRKHLNYEEIGKYLSYEEIRKFLCNKETSKFIQNEDGSAIVEFVALGLPLFLPLFIFLANVSQISSDQRIVQNLARQVARAYVTAPNEGSALTRVEMVKSVFASKYFQSSNSGARNISININCSASPCLTLDSQVMVSASLTSADGAHVYSSSATEIVDKWRNSN